MKTKNKEQKIQNVEKKTCCGRGKLWKIIAGAVVLIFVLFVIGGIVKMQHFKSNFVTPTQEQIDSAKAIATEKLESFGLNASNYEVKVGGKMMKQPRNETRMVIPVEFRNNETTHMFLVDVNNGQILIHSQTDIYVPMNGPFNRMSPPSDGQFKGLNKIGEREGSQKSFEGCKEIRE